MSKIKITKADIGRSFVTKAGHVVKIMVITKHGSYPVETNFGAYTAELKWINDDDRIDDFSHWVDEPAPITKPARTPEWWATFNAVLPAVALRHATSTDYESMVTIATEITNETHK
jgi:hypothetical protein